MKSILLQSRGSLTMPHDSTVGVGAGFYWFAAGFLLFITLGAVKAYYDDKKWEGKVIKMKSRKEQPKS